MKKIALLLTSLLIISSLTACGTKDSEPTPTPTPNPIENTVTPAPSDKDVDAVSSASLNVKDADVLAKSIGKDGKWIVCTVQDIETDKDLVMEGVFYDKDDQTKGEKHKLALYTQDADKKVTARFTLTAPTLTIKSPNALIQGGIFKGDVYVDAMNFHLNDAKIEGNLYFATQEQMDSFKMTDGKDGYKAEVTGVQEIKTK